MIGHPQRSEMFHSSITLMLQKHWAYISMFGAWKVNIVREQNKIKCFCELFVLSFIIRSIMWSWRIFTKKMKNCIFARANGQNNSSQNISYEKLMWQFTYIWPICDDCRWSGTNNQNKAGAKGHKLLARYVSFTLFHRGVQRNVYILLELSWLELL